MKTVFFFCLFWSFTLFAKDVGKPVPRLESGYIVSIQILEDKQDPVSQRIPETGEIQVPYIGLKKVAGKTCAEAAAEIRTELERRYFTKATVFVKIEKLKEYEGCFPEPVASVIVFGNVVQPGKFYFPWDSRGPVSALLAAAGGYTGERRFPRIKIVRRTPQGEKTILVHGRAVFIEKRTEFDLYLRSNDFIFVD
ncbi:MAG: polysaccharide biosynthesis/export family protein [Prosthecobacter sp.]|jgi:protein involved in polysaccharide export with SLBB domain